MMTMGAGKWVLVALAAGGWLNEAGAAIDSIYTCTDAKGRKITSDRPILECIDREQKELNPSGTVRRQVGPSLTAEERTRAEEKEKAAAEERARQAEEKRRDRALLTRYPSREVHDKERADALLQVDAVIKAATRRIEELQGQRKVIDGELDFYKKDSAKMPPSLKRQVDENDASMGVQRRFIADQETEKKRVNMRFDEELVKLKQLWVMAAAPVAPAKAASAPVRAASASAKPASARN
jgi:hypothetical protein